MSEAGVQRWQAPSLAGPVHAPASRPGARTAGFPLTAEHLADIESQAREEGYRQGREEGLRDGGAEIQRQVSRLAELMDTLAPQALVLDDALSEQLAMLVTVAVRQFVRRELVQQPGEIVRVVRESVAALPASESRVSLHLHPEDALLVREALNLDQFERPWRVVEDTNLTRGGVRVETDTSVVDASVESRLAALFSRLLGDTRSTAGE